MPVLGITGGPACGKSSFLEALSVHFPGCRTFSADAEVRRLTAGDAAVRSEITSCLGPSAYSQEGDYNREWVRNTVFQSRELREKLNAILHPRVRQAWVEIARNCHSNENWLLVEIPLLYETQGDSFCERVITVACSTATQIQRLTALRGLPLDIAEKIRTSQSALQEKIKRADHFIWNDCPFNCLTRQAALCAAWLRASFS